MIRNHLLFSTLFLVVTVCAHSQPSFVDPLKVMVSSSKTTHLVFPFPIKSIDRGSSDILAQKSPGTDAVLQLKADHPKIGQTNLTVITVNNRLYSFLVVYDSMPLHLTLVFDSLTTGYRNLPSFESMEIGSGNKPGVISSADILRFAQEVTHKKRNRVHLHSSHDRLSVYLTGIYTKEDQYFFLFRLRNRSDVSYSLASLSFTVRDTKHFKRVASQEKPVPILYQLGTEKAIEGPGRSVWVAVTPKFTLEDRKQLDIQILEEDGGRNISFEISNKTLLSARKL